RCSTRAHRRSSTWRAAGGRRTRSSCSRVRAAGITRVQRRRTGHARAPRLRPETSPVGPTGLTIATDDLVASPAWFPLENIEGEAVRLIQLDEAAYRAASFLDQRLLGAGY